VKHPTPRTLLLALAALAIALLAARAFLVGKAVPTVAVTRETITETVISSGRIITPERVELGAELVGNVARRLVDEGDTVRAGQILAELDASELRAAAEQAASSLAEAEARLEQLRQVSRPVADQNLIQAEANLALANSEYERVRKIGRAHV
jgi:HlyD family secretion protein